MKNKQITYSNVQIANTITVEIGLIFILQYK